MTDYREVELRLGQTVAFSLYKNGCIGHIVRFTPKKVEIKYRSIYPSNKDKFYKTIKFPSEIIVIQDQNL